MSFDDLLGEYWDLAFQEGKSGVNNADKANAVLHKLRALLKTQSASVYTVLVHNGIPKQHAWKLRGRFDSTSDPKDGSLVAYYSTDRKEAIAVHDYLIETGAVSRYNISMMLRHFVFSDGRWHQRLSNPISRDSDLFNKPLENDFSPLVAEALNTHHKEEKPSC